MATLVSKGEFTIVDVNDGVNGLNTASIFIYQRSATTPALPSSAVSYTFSTKSLGALTNGWQSTIPSGTDPLYVTVATASSSSDIASIATNAWSAAVVLSQNGTPGNAGLNVATIYLYQRSTTTPALPSATVTYTFSTKSLTGLTNSWQTTIPAGTNPLYVTIATASSTTDTDTILATEWSTAAILTQNGVDSVVNALVLSSPVITKDAPDAATSGTHTSVTIQGKKYSGATTTNYGWVTVTANGAVEATTATDTSVTAITLAPANTDGKTSYTVRMYNQATVAGATLLDTKTISVVFKGATGSSGTSSRAVALSLGTQAFTYTSAGSSPSPASTVVTATAYNTVGTVYYEFLVEGASVQNTTTATYTYTAQAAFANMPDKIEVRIREGASTGTVLATDEVSVVGIKPGADGSPGAAGLSAITVVLSNSAHTVPTDSAGNNGNYTGSGTTIRVYEGATELNYDGVGASASNWNVTPTGSSITAGGKTDSGTYVTIGVHSNMVADTASVSYAVTGYRSNGTAFSQTVTQTLSKSKAGAGTPGLSGAMTFRIYYISSSAAAPAAPGSTLNGATPTTPAGWSASPTSTLNTGQYMYQSDGTQAAGSTTTVWGAPYLSNLKVGNLSALAANMGALTVDSTLIAGTSADGITIDGVNKRIDAKVASSVLARFGNLGTTYGIAGWKSGVATEIFKLDSNGLEVKMSQSSMNKVGGSNKMQVVLQGDTWFTGTGTQTSDVLIPVSTAGIFRIYAHVTAYYENFDFTVSKSLIKFMAVGVHFNNKTSLTTSMGTTVISSDTTDTTNFPGSKADFYFNTTNEQMYLRLTSLSAQTAGSKTVFSYVCLAMDNAAYPYSNFGLYV